MQIDYRKTHDSLEITPPLSHLPVCFSLVRRDHPRLAAPRLLNPGIFLSGTERPSPIGALSLTGHFQPVTSVRIADASPDGPDEQAAQDWITLSVGFREIYMTADPIHAPVKASRTSRADSNESATTSSAVKPIYAAVSNVAGHGKVRRCALQFVTSETKAAASYQLISCGFFLQLCNCIDSDARYHLLTVFCSESGGKGNFGKFRNKCLDVRKPVPDATADLEKAWAGYAVCGQSPTATPRPQRLFADASDRCGGSLVKQRVDLCVHSNLLAHGDARMHG